MTGDETESDTVDDARFTLAGRSASRIVRLWRAHTRITVKSLAHYTSVAPPSSLYATDRANAIAGNHSIAFGQTVKQVETLSNVLMAHLDGLDVLMQHEKFHGLPATVIARSIAEVSASCSWILRPDATADMRAARAYASLFHSLQNSTPQLIPEDAARAVELREQLVDLLSASGITVKRREKDGSKSEDVAQVFVGSARATTSYTIAQRIAGEMPAIGWTYAGLSSVTHGESLNVANAWAQPDSYARRIGFVVNDSLEVWSKAIHGWVAVEPGPVDVAEYLANLTRSIHPDVIAEFVARLETGAETRAGRPQDPEA
jgi:hypothetical protein